MTNHRFLTPLYHNSLLHRLAGTKQRKIQSVAERNPFQEISERAGLGRIRCPFVNMRRSLSNDEARQYGKVLESQWIGHTVDVSEKFYRMQLDEDFTEAVSGDFGDQKLYAKSHALGRSRMVNVATFS